MGHKYRPGDHVSVTELPGTWVIVCPGPDSGYVITPHRQNYLRALFSGTIITATESLSDWTPPWNSKTPLFP